MTEQQAFNHIASEAGFEVRYYPDYVLVQVTTRGEFASAANQAFRPLVNFISGRNKNQVSYSMTAPVLHSPNPQGIEHTISFVLPAGTDIKSVPLPLDAVVSTKAVKGHFAAAIKFRGLANYNHFQTLGQQLITAVQSAGLEPVGEPYYARFDPPWKPGFLRHNEALLALKGYPSKGKK